MTSIVEVKLELGHRAKVREVPLPEGHTHDWVIFVKGSEGVQLEHFVEKVVFWLHESYDQPKRVIKHSPYKVEQSGYAGFNMLIDVHFRNKEDPKMVRFQYDLFLHTEAMPPVNHTRLEKLTFTNPTEDFRKKLLKAGAIPINLSSSHSKERRERSPGSSSKKDKIKSKEGIKQRERSSSSGRKDQDERKKISAYIGKKDGRIAGKDMKHHDSEFKQPKDIFNINRNRKESGGEKLEVVERGRSEKKRTLGVENNGNKKKKKRHFDDLPSLNSKSKSSTTATGSTPVSSGNLNKKEKIKKMKENIIEGLFAPGASININQIKQNKDKGKQDGTEVKMKKDKNIIPSKTTSSRDSPAPVTNESSSSQYSKVSVGNDLTLKIKKIPPTKIKKEKSSAENAKKMEESSERKHSKESLSMKATVDSSNNEQRFKKKVPPMSPSSSSNSDMNISDEDGTRKKKHQELRKAEKVYNTSTKSKTKLKLHEEQAKGFIKQSESSLVKKSRSKTKNKDLAKHTDVPLNSSPASVESKSKEMSLQKGRTKHNKSSKDDGRRSESLNREEDRSLTILKKHKHSSKERSRDSFLSKKSSRMPTPSLAGDPPSVTLPNPIKPKNISDTYPAPGATFLDETKDVSPKKSDSSKRGRKNSKKTDKGLTSSPESINKKSKKEHIAKRDKASPTAPSLNVTRNITQPKKVFKSNSFVETSSDEEDSEFEDLLDRKCVVELGKKLPSVSSSSSLASHDNSHAESDLDDHVHPTSAPSPISSSSSDEELEVSIFPPAEESTLSVISPIVDKSVSHTASQNALCDDMELSDTSGGSPIESHHDPTIVTSNIDAVDELETPQELTDISLPPFSLQDDLSSSSDEDEDTSPVQKPFQYQHEMEETSHRYNAEHDANNNDNEQDTATCSRSISEPIVEVSVGAERKSYPHLTGPLYKELQEIHRKLSYVTDVNRLRKIAVIVAKSQKTEITPNCFDFDLCSLDHSTIHKIEKHLKAT